MRECTCKHCTKTVPLNESFTVFGEQLCLACTEIQINANPEMPADAVQQNMDLTVCAKCGQDGGSLDLDQIMGYPICMSCAPNFGNLPFPLWIKLGALALAVLVVLSLGLNSRFIRANFELEQYYEALGSGDYQAAALLSESAARHVPEVVDLQYLSYYGAGLAYLKDDKPREALENLNKCRDYLPPNFEVEKLTKNAMRNIAFDEHDYDEFLRLAEEDYENDPKDMWNISSLASALACKFAETGIEGFRSRSERALEKLQSNDKTDEQVEYEMRMRHRLHTREIISPQEFTERYPDGWEIPEGEK